MGLAAVAPGNFDVTPGINAYLDTFVNKTRSAFQIAPLPFDGRAVASAFLMLYFGETGASIAALARHLGRSARPRDVEPTTWLLGLLGRTYSAADFAAARHTWNDSARRMGRFHQTYDLLLTPTLATPPVPTPSTSASGN